MYQIHALLDMLDLIQEPSTIDSTTCSTSTVAGTVQYSTTLVRTRTAVHAWPGSGLAAEMSGKSSARQWALSIPALYE